MIIFQFLEALFVGFKIGIQAILSVIPIYREISSLQTEIIAMVLGVSPIVITIASFFIKFFKKVLFNN